MGAHSRKLVALQRDVSGLAKEQGEAVDQLGSSLTRAKQREVRYKQKIEELRRRQWSAQDEAQMQSDMKVAIEKAVETRTTELEKKYTAAVNGAFDRDIAPVLRQA